MQDALRLILSVIPLITGAIAIFFSYQLMRRYKEAFVGSYFYYVVFLYIFGAYSLIGSGFMEFLFSRMNTEEKIIHSARLFAILLGIPLLLLSHYMLLRSTLDMFNKKVPLTITVTYFIHSIAALTLYGLFVVRLTQFGIGEYQLLIAVQRWLFIGFLVLLYTSVFIITLLLSRKLVEHERTFTRLMGLLSMIYMIVTCSTFFLTDFFEILKYVFIIFFLSWHLIPIFFLNIHLAKYYGKTATVQQDFEALLSTFCSQYEISKRESEVVKLICKGLSNQEIGDSLFISLQTVKDHTHRIFVKTGVKNRVQLTNLIRTK
jgi:DNA-binding CsgD family transcriptional regulator